MKKVTENATRRKFKRSMKKERRKYTGIEINYKKKSGRLGYKNKIIDKTIVQKIMVRKIKNKR